MTATHSTAFEPVNDGRLVVRTRTLLGRRSQPVYPWTFWFRLGLLATLGAIGSGCAEPQARPLSPDELTRVEVDGRVSRWLPIRWSGSVTNGLDDLTLTSIELEIDGQRFERTVELAPGVTGRLSLQFVFPEDPRFGKIDPDAVESRLVAATGRSLD